MSACATTVYRKKAAATKSFRKARAERDPEDFTEAINSADSHEVALKLLAEKQAAERAGRPPRRSRSPEPAQDADHDQIKDPGLRRNYEQSKAREVRREAETKCNNLLHLPPLLTSGKPARNGSYAHGLSMGATLEKVCTKPDISGRAKSIALVLSAHWPNIRPTNDRLRLLTGLSKRTIERGLTELKANKLLDWKRGKPRKANEYACHWLPAPHSVTVTP